LTVADPCIWHVCGTNLSRRQSATMAGAPANHACVCLDAPPLASATLPVCPSTGQRHGRHCESTRRIHCFSDAPRH
jgi:hypothetical protein